MHRPAPRTMRKPVNSGLIVLKGIWKMMLILRFGRCFVFLAVQFPKHLLLAKQFQISLSFPSLPTTPPRHTHLSLPSTLPPITCPPRYVTHSACLPVPAFPRPAPICLSGSLYSTKHTALDDSNKHRQRPTTTTTVSQLILLQTTTLFPPPTAIRETHPGENPISPHPLSPTTPLHKQ